MKKGILFCNAGYSSSAISAKLNELGKDYNIQFDEGGFGSQPIETIMKNYDIVIFAPHLRAQGEEIEDICDEENFPFIQMSGKEYSVIDENILPVFNKILNKLKINHE